MTNTTGRCRYRVNVLVVTVVVLTGTLSVCTSSHRSEIPGSFALVTQVAILMFAHIKNVIREADEKNAKSQIDPAPAHETI